MRVHLCGVYVWVDVGVTYAYTVYSQVAAGAMVQLCKLSALNMSCIRTLMKAMVENCFGPILAETDHLKT